MGVLARLLGAGHPEPDPELLDAVERAVDMVEPRLKQIGGYPERYLAAVAHARAYASDLARRLPGPVHISRATYASDPLVHALFATPDDVRVALCASRAMHAFRATHPEAGEVYALIAMRRSTKAVLGMALEGEVLRRDVAQQAVYFTDHTVADPGLTEAQARARIAEGFFDSLAKHVRLRVEANRGERAALELARDEWLARLHGAKPERRAECEAGLQDTLERLGRVTETLDLRRYAEDFDAVMLAPERHLSIERTRMALDAMGMLREPEPDGRDEVEFCDLLGRDRRRWTVVLMYCDQVRDETAMGDRLSMAQRWLGL